jgi:hypothetical protein
VASPGEAGDDPPEGCLAVPPDGQVQEGDQRKGQHEALADPQRIEGVL